MNFRGKELLSGAFIRVHSKARPVSLGTVPGRHAKVPSHHGRI